MGAVELLQGIRDPLEGRTKNLKESRGRSAGGGIVVPFFADIDMVRLDIEDELVLGPFLCKCFLVLGFGGIDFETGTEDLIERQERGRHPTARAHKIPPANSLTPSRPFADVGDTRFIFLLLGRLDRWYEFFVRGNSGRDRRHCILVSV
jgi:hypothetical protein